MSRLITDIFVRRAAQSALLLVLLGMGTMAMLLCLILLARRLGITQELVTDAAIAVVALLIFPLADVFGQTITVVIAAIPVVFAAVCFVPDLSGATPKTGTQLNRVGRAAFLLLLVGGAGWLSLFAVFQLNPLLLEELAGDQTTVQLAKATVAGVVAFHGNYLAVILGVNK
ncbi:hypothetical protein [Devosia beringensis]|uniref:hypothetical protein n=1 Tax=Devosia beringensis TaxID=2657486 RepID=UPI00186BB2D3|nr:hypothetical protein [Devosia beringensis]